MDISKVTMNDQINEQINGGIRMINRKKRIWFAIFSVIMLLLVGIISTSYAQALPDFGGTWNTVTGKGKKIVLTLQTVRRTNVTGNYAMNGLTGRYQPMDRSVDVFVKVAATTALPLMQTPSSIRGTVTDNVLRFKWFEEGSHGAGRFTMSSDGQSFEGTFSTTDNPDDTSGGTWNGTRVYSFAGAWRGKLGEGGFELILQQAGSQVTGQFNLNSVIFDIKGGIADINNTLRFTIVRPGKVLPNGTKLPDEVLGTGELVMDTGGKSFKGKILNADSSGTRVGR